MLYPGRQGLRSPAQLSPESLLNGAMRGWPRLNRNDPINQGLVGYWSMDGGTISGTTLADLSGNGNNGSLINVPALATGRVGQTLVFNGSTQYVSLPSIAYPIAATGISVCGWFYATGNAGAIRCLWRVDDTAAGHGVGAYIWSDNKARLYEAGNAGPFGSTLINLNQWYHFCGTFSPSVWNLYINGQVDGSPNVFTEGSVTGTSRLAVDQFSNAFAGNLDDIRIYNRVLSVAEIQRVYLDTTGNLGLIVPVRSFGAAVNPPLSASVIVTQGPNTIAATAAVTNRGRVVQSQAANTIVATVTNVDQAQLVKVQGANTLAATAAAANTASVVRTQGADTVIARIGGPILTVVTGPSDGENDSRRRWLEWRESKFQARQARVAADLGKKSWSVETEKTPPPIKSVSIPILPIDPAPAVTLLSANLRAMRDQRAALVAKEVRDRQDEEDAIALLLGD